MPERLKQIIDKIGDWWKRFSTKQKTLIVSIAAVVVVALIILGMVVSRPTMVTLITCDSATQASQVKDLLDGESIPYELSQDGLTFTVNKKDEANASILLGSNSIPSEGYSIDDAIDGSFSTTEADKTKKYQLYLESAFADKLETISNIETATVTLSIPEDDGTIISQGQDTYASVILKLNGEMTDDQAAGIAQYIATEVGNDDTDSILILDSDGNVLFSGGDSNSQTGNANSQLALTSKTENAVKSKVKDVVLGTDVYDNAEVGLNLVLDFDKTDVTDHEYYVADGQTQGYLDSESSYESESDGGAAATPGTDSNDDTTYVIQDNNTTHTTVSDYSKDYLPNERITTTTGSVGNIDYDQSSITVALTRYVVYNEDALKADGTLDGMTFDDYVAANSDRVKTDVDPDFYTMVSRATGISENNISIVAYDVPFFQYSENNGRTLTDYLQIALAVLILAMLGYVVFRSTRKEEAVEVEPELSVESLLETTKEAESEQLEDIGFNEKSETRLMIEKFVDENPEAVASLLRNWLNEEWN